MNEKTLKILKYKYLNFDSISEVFHFVKSMRTQTEQVSPFHKYTVLYTGAVLYTCYTQFLNAIFLSDCKKANNADYSALIIQTEYFI